MIVQRRADCCPREKRPRHLQKVSNFSLERALVIIPATLSCVLAIKKIDYSSIMLFSDIVIVHFNMFGPGMKNRILGNCNCTLAVSKNRSRVGIHNTKIFHQSAKPHTFHCRCECCSVLSFT